MKKFETYGIRNVEGKMATGAALTDGFLARSKEIFGIGLEAEPQFPGLPFIIPLLSAANFFNYPHEEVHRWFELFDVYINESPTDQGVLMAVKDDFDSPLVELLQQMRQNGLEYPEGG